MRDFRTIQNTLGNLPNIPKIYLLGSTGAGKTSLVQHILGTAKLRFPTISQRRTTVAPTEYVISKNRKYKTTIIFKQKEDLIELIRERIEAAMIKAMPENATIEDIVFELEQTPDERFKLKQIIKESSLENTAQSIFHNVRGLAFDREEEVFLQSVNIQEDVNLLTNEFIIEIEQRFNELTNNEYRLFNNQPYIIDGYNDKSDFIKKSKELLANSKGSISALVEYARIEGNLLADWLDDELEFILIDSEGIGHSLKEKRDSLSTRHHDYFSFCDSIVLVENSENPFMTGGQGAIESIFLSGYETKFKLVFSQTDKLATGSSSDTNYYFRRSLKNLSEALKENVRFELENKDTFKLANLNQKEISVKEQKEIIKLLKSINETSGNEIVPLEYDFNELFLSLDIDKFTEEFQGNINPEHWAVVKAFTRRMSNKKIEYRHIQPMSWILRFFMQNINTFLSREDDLQSDVSFSINEIKQNFSRKIIKYIYINFINENNHLWQQAYEKNGSGSDKKRKEFIFNQILNSFLPNKDTEEFYKLVKDVKNLLLESGAKELKSATKIRLEKVEIKKIYGDLNFIWNLESDTNILVGKNGSGKSTIIKLIDACINNKKEIFKQYEYPYIKLTIEKKYSNGDVKKVELKNNNILPDIKSILISTFDISTLSNSQTDTYLDVELGELIVEFGQYQRSLSKIIAKEIENETKQFNDILENIADASPEDLARFKELKIEIDRITKLTNKPIQQFKEIIDSYFESTSKKAIIDDEKSSLIVELEKDGQRNIINTTQLSSGEKQLLIIFLTVILQKDKPLILLMDEPETSLHVEWQSTIIDNIHRIKSNIQIIVATHNPILTLNRRENEIGIIQPDNEIIQSAAGTKYLDVSSVLLTHFGLSSLIGKDMQEDIKNFTELKLKEETLKQDEKDELDRLNRLLENSYAGDIVYNKKYFTFLKFLKENKSIDFNKFEEIDEDDFQEFLKEFGGNTMINMSSLHKHPDYSNALDKFKRSQKEKKWSLFKDVQLVVSKNKCPVCECPLDGTLERKSNNGTTLLAPTIDHFRPQDLYPKLKHDHENYILMCSDCNNAYKGCKFPLHSSTQNRNTTAEKTSNITDEKPLVVNPIYDNLFDLFKLVFRQTISGKKVLELIPKEQSGYLYEKAKETIKIFSLGNCEEPSHAHKSPNVQSCRVMLLADHF